MAKKKIHVRWTVEVTETYEADLEIDENEIPEDYKNDEQSFLLIERLPGLEAIKARTSADVFEREIDVFEVSS